MNTVSLVVSAFLVGYGIIGLISVVASGCWILRLSREADSILKRGNSVAIRKGPTFSSQSDRSEMQYCILVRRGLGTLVFTFFFWPLTILIIVWNPECLMMIDEIPVVVKS